MSTPMFERIRLRLLRATLTTAVAGWVFSSANANASTQYLTVLSGDPWNYRGLCTVCHTSNLGGAGTVVTPMGLTLMDAGVVGMMDEDAFGESLSVLSTEDSDGDGATDADELMNGGDPNDPSVLPGGFVPPLEETYGCLRVSRAPAGSDSLGVLSAGLLGLVLTSSLLRRRRRP